MAEIARRARLAIIASHPIQYQAPLFRELASRFDLSVFFAHRAREVDQAEAGFGVGFNWDTDLLSGYDHVFMENVASEPGLHRFLGCDTPEIFSRLSESPFDAVLVNGWHLKSYLQAAYAARRLGLPLLVRGDSHLGTPRSRLKIITKSIVYPSFLRAFNAALYVGKRSHEYWRHYRYPESRLFFSPHCVDNEWFAARATESAREEMRARLGIPASATVALFAGKLVPFKRPLDLIAAAKSLTMAGHDIRVLVAGAGPLAAELADAARESKVSTHVLGFVNQTRMPQVYAASDVLVLPSDGRETWGLVANEALACSRPILLADTVGAAPDLAADAVAGKVFPVGDISALSAALLSIVGSPPSPRVIAAKSKVYSLEAAADGIEAALSRLLRCPKDEFAPS